MDELLSSPQKVIRTGKMILLFLCTCLFLVLCFFSTYFYIQSKPKVDFPVNQDIIITEGLTHREIVEVLEQKKLVQSKILSQVILKFFFRDKYLLAGTYRFTTPLDTFNVIKALVDGAYKTPALKLVLPEGFTVSDFYDYLPSDYAYGEKIRPDIYEGKLFPDTYFISKDMRPADIFELLEHTMDLKMSVYNDQIAKSGFTKEEVIILASILEREANSSESMKHVSGILQNRLKIGMPLQVDATLDYVLHKENSELSLDDLKMNDPMNTYIHTGLPPRPISNPGITAIEAVLEPMKTDDLYYLTDAEGVFHYARTFEEHKLNKERFLR